MIVEFHRKQNQTDTMGSFNDIKIVGEALIADGKEIAFFDRDESYWSEDGTYNTAINEITIKP